MLEDAEGLETKVAKNSFLRLVSMARQRWTRSWSRSTVQRREKEGVANFALHHSFMASS